MHRCCDFLPGDLMLDIFSRLPVKSLMRLRCVSRAFRDLTHSPAFLSMHLQRSSSDDKQYFFFLQKRDNLVSFLFSSKDDEYPTPLFAASVAGSCNGLICLYDQQLSPHLVLWNPATKQSRCLPTPEIDAHSFSTHGRLLDVSYGFAFDPHTKDYKVVRILFYRDHGVDRALVEVYTLRSNSWRVVEDVKLPCDLITIAANPAVVVNGSMHYIGLTRLGDRFRESLVAFDICAEKFTEISLPLPTSSIHRDDDRTEPYKRFSVSAFKETIALFDFRGVGGHFGGFLDVWVLVDDYGGAKEQRWTKKFTVGPFSGSEMPFTILGLWKRDAVIVVKYEQKYVLYDLRTEEFNYGPFDGDTTLNFEFFPYVESLVSVR